VAPSVPRHYEKETAMTTDMTTGLAIKQLTPNAIAKAMLPLDAAVSDKDSIALRHLASNVSDWGCSVMTYDEAPDVVGGYTSSVAVLRRLWNSFWIL